MALPLFYYPDDYKTSTIHVEGELTKHILQVLRLKPYDELLLTDGKGGVAQVSIAAIHKKSFDAKVLKFTKHPASKRELKLYIAFTKNNSRNEWLIEKAVELGVQNIHPLITQRSDKYAYKKERWKTIVVSAMQQSQQYYLPTLHEPETFNDAIVNSTSSAEVFLAHCDDSFPKKNLRESLHPSVLTAAVFIGPEGDFTKEEINVALENNVKCIDLGNTRLRTETAAMAVCAYFKMIGNE